MVVKGRDGESVVGGDGGGCESVVGECGGRGIRSWGREIRVAIEVFLAQLDLTTTTCGGDFIHCGWCGNGVGTTQHWFGECAAWRHGFALTRVLRWSYWWTRPRPR